MKHCDLTVLFSKEISISTLNCKMSSVPLHATLKGERGSRLCHLSGVHHSKLCGEKTMEERVEDCLREQKFEMHEQCSGFSSNVAHHT